MLRPAGAQHSALSAASPTPAGPASVAAADPAPSRSTPAWPFVTLAAVLVILMGVGATFAVRHFFADDTIITDPPPPTGPGEPAASPNPPESVEVQVIAPAQSEAGKNARARVQWAMPEGFQDDYFYEVQWVDLPENYSDFAVKHPQYGRDSIVIEVPPNLSGLCVQVRTLAPNGGASSWEQACLEGE